MTKCPTCIKNKPLKAHLFELSELCRYLGNSVEFTQHGSTRIVKTSVIGDWLKLASHLKKVHMDWWRYRNVMSEMYCPSDIDEEASDEEHFTEYSTALTRFMYVTNAMEEAYRFIDKEYHSLDSVINMPKKKRLREPSMRATVVIDLIPKEHLPENFFHIMSNLEITFERYTKDFSLTVNGIGGVNKNDISAGLHLIRCLRNHIAHGVFPIVDNPEYCGREDKNKNLLNLLFHACRASAVYIQTILLSFNEGFQSHDYFFMIEAWDEEGYYFESNCKIELAKSLHLKGTFSFAEPLEADC
ncbi:hypothetical protein H5125_05135 [Shewanella sp. SR44-4]|uniref:hypothetical protein n=1 Tax=Shewanella sp. SR44-4 TaxID=2760935 RepID=UPI001602AB96|nr:hypothetical protein [Shewanella sp. SR44-4]MBB1361540.1 hypothetical protein [Shewanella sp. SR44-4]